MTTTTIDLRKLDSAPVRPFVVPTTTPEHAQFIADAYADQRDVLVVGWMGKHCRCKIMDVHNGLVKVNNYTLETPFVTVDAQGRASEVNIIWLMPDRVEPMPVEPEIECTCHERPDGPQCATCAATAGEQEMPC